MFSTSLNVVKVADVTQTTRRAKAMKYAGGLMQAVNEVNKSWCLNTATFTWSLKLNKNVVMYFSSTFTYILRVPWEPGECNQCSILGYGLDSAGFESQQGNQLTSLFFLIPRLLGPQTFY